MKILEIIPNFCTGGAEIMCENLIYAMQNMGHDVTAVSIFKIETDITRRLKLRGVDIRFTEKISGGIDLKTIRELRMIIKEVKPDVIHTHLYVIHYGILASLFLGVKCRVHTIHSVALFDAKKKGRLYNSIGFRMFGVVPIALSEGVRDTVLQVYHMKQDKVPVIYNGIYLGKCIKKQNYGFAENINLIHVGRLTAEKNHINMLRAVKSLHDKYPNIVLHMYGDGDLFENIHTFVDENDMANYAIMHGSTDDVYSHLHDADIFILPSTTEGIPMTIIEAMGTGLPVVASNVGGIPDMIEDGETGLLCGTDVQSIADCISAFIDSKEMRERCGKAALVSAERFSSKKMAERYIEIFNVRKKKNGNS